MEQKFFITSLYYNLLHKMEKFIDNMDRACSNEIIEEVVLDAC